MDVINVIDENDQLIETSLDGLIYYVHLSWNESAQQYYLGIRDINETSLVEGVSE